MLQYAPTEPDNSETLSTNIPNFYEDSGVYHMA